MGIRVMGLTLRILRVKLNNFRDGGRLVDRFLDTPLDWGRCG